MRRSASRVRTWPSTGPCWRAFACALALGLDRVEARCDARLIVEQVLGRREPANPRLRELGAAVRDAAEQIGTVVFTWVPAEANARAHALVAEALARRP